MRCRDVSRDWKCAEYQPLCHMWTGWALEDLPLNRRRPTQGVTHDYLHQAHFGAARCTPHDTYPPTNPGTSSLTPIRCQAISADCRQSPFWLIQLRDGALKPHPGPKLELRSQGLCREDACVLRLDVELVRPGPGRPPPIQHRPSTDAHWGNDNGRE